MCPLFCLCSFCMPWFLAWCVICVLCLIVTQLPPVRTHLQLEIIIYSTYSHYFLRYSPLPSHNNFLFALFRFSIHSSKKKSFRVSYSVIFVVSNSSSWILLRYLEIHCHVTTVSRTLYRPVLSCGSWHFIVFSYHLRFISSFGLELRATV
jgi:hypothetical protein